MALAIAAIVVLVGSLYVISPIPYLSDTENYSMQSTYPIVIPGVAVLLILVLLFVVPSRAKFSGDVATDRVKHSQEHRFREISLVSGATAGFIGAWILTGVVLVGDTVLGLPSGTLYSVIGIAMGFDESIAMSVGVGLHLLTGTLVGVAFGYATGTVELLKITSLNRGIVFGILTGFLSFSVIFIPITRFEVEPSLLNIIASIYPSETSQTALQDKVLDIMSAVLAGSILMHLLFGTILGAITSVLVDRYRKVMKSEIAKRSHAEAG